LEQSLIGSSGTVLGYENGRPILESVIPHYAQVKRTEAVRKGIFAFQAKWLQFKAKLKETGRVLSAQAYLDIDSRNAVILQRLFLHPLKAEAEAFGQLRHDDNFGSKTGGIICADADLAALHKHGYESIASQSTCYWPQGVYHMLNSNVSNMAFSYFDLINT
jgi:hypothetical protein